jgi:hypothetical protein
MWSLYDTRRQNASNAASRRDRFSALGKNGHRENSIWTQGISFM